MKKIRYSIIFILFGFILIAQKASLNARKSSLLVEYSGFEQLSDFRSVVYGKFVQRLGFFTSGGYPQYIYLLNVETNLISSLTVKQANAINKESDFCFCIRPGTYEILEYEWTKYLVLLYKTYTQTINRAITGAVPESSNRYRFTVAAGTVNYIGTWHFETPKIYFTNEKTLVDDTFKKKYKGLDFSKASTIIPE